MVIRTNGFARLERTLLEDLPMMSGAACKVYVALLIVADYRTGRCTVDAAALAQATGLSRRSVERALSELERVSLIRWTRGSNGHVPAAVEVLSHGELEPCGQCVDNVPVSVDGTVDRYVDSLCTARSTATYMSHCTTAHLRERA